MDETHEIEISVTDFDPQLLPADARETGSDAFRQAVSAFVESEFRGFAGRVDVVVDRDRIRISWRSRPDAPDPLEEAASRLRNGDYSRGIQLLRFILAHRPHDSAVHYNLGMALSDLRRLDEAMQHLREAIELDPSNTGARIALGVALGRSGKYEDAVEILDKVLAESPDDPLALRNLAGCLMSLNRDLPRAEQCLRAVAAAAPTDQSMWLALAQALEMQGKSAEADESYGKAVALNPASELAETARRAQSAMSQAGFRGKAVGGIRPDALAYCQEALERFAGMTEEDVRRIGVEIAMLGTKGLSPNDPTTRHRLKSLPGDFSGLELICYMYIAWQRIDPKADIGFDVSNEYQAAVSLFRKRGDGS